MKSNYFASVVILRNQFNQRKLAKGGSITVLQLTSLLTGLNLTRQLKLLLIQLIKAAESKQNKQEVQVMPSTDS